MPAKKLKILVSPVSLLHEQRAQQDGYRFIIGVDEAGRGPLAGPVVAAAVWLTDSSFSCRIGDSKKLSPAQRERAFLEICQKAVIGVGIIGEKVVDEQNILQATFHAMTRAVDDLVSHLPVALRAADSFEREVCLLIDGPLFRGAVPYSYHTIVQGDNVSLSIAAASIVAKVTRDRILMIYDQVYPQYGFRQHKGYGTAQHRAAIIQHGISPIHRRTFIN